MCGSPLGAQPNAKDVVWGMGILSLEREPFVIQVPDFGSASGVPGPATSAAMPSHQLGRPYGSAPGCRYLHRGPGLERQRNPWGFPGVFRLTEQPSLRDLRRFLGDASDDHAAVAKLITRSRLS